MREWALRAGLGDERIPNHIKMVYSTDCAAVSIQHKLMSLERSGGVGVGDEFEFVSSKRTKSGLSMSEGTKYVVVDAGGGTVDISGHEWMGNMRIREAASPSGGDWGSSYIDDAFMSLLASIFGAELMDRFKSEESGSHRELLENFRASKLSFYGEIGHRSSRCTHSVDLGHRFLSFLVAECDRNDMDLVEDMMAECVYSHDIRLKGSSLSLSYNVWRNVLFNKVVDPMVEAVAALLETQAMRDCGFLFVVGGLSSSLYVRHRLNERFGDEVVVAVPSSPILSVVEGAALLGLNAQFVQQRVMSKCYGTSVNSKLLNKGWMDRALLRRLTQREKQRHFNLNRQCFVKIFKPIITQNEVVSVDGKPIVVEGARNTANNNAQKHTTIKIYECSDPKNTFFIDHDDQNTKLMATASIVWPKDDKQRNKIILELFFHDTTISGYVYAAKYPEDKKLLQLKYEFQ